MCTMCSASSGYNRASWTFHIGMIGQLVGTFFWILQVWYIYTGNTCLVEVYIPSTRYGTWYLMHSILVPGTLLVPSSKLDEKWKFKIKSFFCPRMPRFKMSTYLWVKHIQQWQLTGGHRFDNFTKVFYCNSEFCWWAIMHYARRLPEEYWVLARY